VKLEERVTPGLVGGGIHLCTICHGTPTITCHPRQCKLGTRCGRSCASATGIGQ
jgi:hypothetical protein